MVELLNKFLDPMKPEKYDQMIKLLSENPERGLECKRLLGGLVSLLESRTLVQKALGKDTKLASIQTGKRKTIADRDINMGGNGTE